MKKTFIVLLLAIIVGGVYYAFGPRPRAWARGAWDAADHDRDGQLTRDEMVVFGKQAPHRNAERLLWHFDRADANGDKIVDALEVETYGTNVGSQDPDDHLPPPN